MKVDGATRAGRPKGQGLASCSWLLVLAGISCTYPVELPGVLADAGRNAGGTGGLAGSDASVDQFSSNDRPWYHGPGGCPNPHTILVNKSNTVEMIIALDRSTSMQQHPFDSMPSRLQAAQQAIPTAINNHQRIRFGLELFPGSSDCNNSAACCAGQVFFSAAPHQSTSIATQMGCGPGDAGCPIAGDDSPSPLALNQCNAAFAKEGPQREGDLSRFVLLVTDRDPTCAGDLSQGTNPCGVATDEASKLGEYVGVQIFVVALNSDGQSTGCLKQIANANAHNFGDDQQFFPATKQTELDQRLGDIMTRAEAPLCGFFLGLGGPNDPDQLEVTVGGTPILPYTSDGWSFSDPYTIVLSGSSCADVMDGQTVTVTTCSPS